MPVLIGWCIFLCIELEPLARLTLKLIVIFFYRRIYCYILIHTKFSQKKKKQSLISLSVDIQSPDDSSCASKRMNHFPFWTTVYCFAKMSKLERQTCTNKRDWLPWMLPKCWCTFSLLHFHLLDSKTNASLRESKLLEISRTVALWFQTKISSFEAN